MIVYRVIGSYGNSYGDQTSFRRIERNKVDRRTSVYATWTLTFGWKDAVSSMEFSTLR